MEPTILSSRPARRGRRAGVTLVEVMSGLTLSTVILAGVLSTVLALGRSGVNAVSYLTMETQSATALEQFARDLRMASDVVTNSPRSITLTVPDRYSGTGSQVTYALDAVPGSGTEGCFYRMPGPAAASNPRTVLARGVSTLSFARFDRTDNPTSDDAQAKRLQVTLQLRSGAGNAPAATEEVSASFVLRNKRIS